MEENELVETKEIIEEKEPSSRQELRCLLKVYLRTCKTSKWK